MTKCVICEKRPARLKGLCVNCSDRFEAERGRKKADRPVKFFTYRGYVVGLYPNGDRTLRAKLLKRNPDNLPKNKTLDLNRYIEGFTREQVKRFKACILQLANA